MNDSPAGKALMNAGHRLAGVDLFTASFLSLFFEMLVIRWIPSELGHMAYFSNLILILACLGLGTGCLLGPSRKRLLRLFPFAALLLVTLVLQSARWRISFWDASRIFVNDAVRTTRAGQSPTALPILLVLLLLGPLVILCFLCLGQEVGRRLRAFRPLCAYAINILGSILGVLAFLWIGWQRLPPAIWFAMAAAAAAWLLRDSPHSLLLGGLALATILVLVVPQAPGIYWSPYYRIHLTPIYDQEGSQRQWFANVLDVNTSFHQYQLDLSGRVSDPPGWASTPFVPFYREIYDLPSRFQAPGRALILGAGGGNDVAAALRHGAQAVDAVEIDPVIAELGRRHPEQPYADARVRLIIDDARSFLRKSRDTYDMIVLGFLDTIRLLSEFSSVRLESYVYTRESLREIRSHLKPDGLVVLAFSTTTEWLLARQVKLITEAFGQPPEVYSSGRASLLVLAPNRRLPVIETAYVKRVDPRIVGRLLSLPIPVPTDDWPFLYLEHRSIPQQYLIVLAVTVALAFALRLVVPTAGGPFLWRFFFLGAGFMLLETLTITRLARFFGSTWIVSSLVVLVMLATALLANGIAARRAPLPRWLMQGALGTTLLAGFAIGELPGWALCLLFGGSVFFAGLIFSTSLREVERTEHALGANILGAVCGGLSEYASLMLGLRALYLIAIAFYALAFRSRCVPRV